MECVEEVLRNDLGIAKKITLGEGSNSPARVEGDEIIIDVMRLDSFQAETGGEAGLVSAYITAAVLYALYGTAEAIEISRKSGEIHSWSRSWRRTLGDIKDGLFTLRNPIII